VAKRKGSSEWTPIYLLIVMIIAAVLIFVFIKPMFKQASQTASENLGEARTIATGVFFLAKKAIDN